MDVNLEYSQFPQVLDKIRYMIYANKGIDRWNAPLKVSIVPRTCHSGYDDNFMFLAHEDEPDNRKYSLPLISIANVDPIEAEALQQIRLSRTDTANQFFKDADYILLMVENPVRAW